METTTETLRVAIVEDDAGFRRGLEALINFTPGYACVGAFYSVENALHLMGAGAADVLLVDINLQGGMPGSEGVKLLREKSPATQVLMLTSLAEEEKVFQSICNGACGYMLKKSRPDELLKAIREAHDGGAPMSPEIARKVITHFQRMPPPEEIEGDLTPQEIRLLQLLSDGFSYQKSADQMNISINTVRNYIRSIYEKLHVNTKSEAVGKALRSRLIN
jgi:DNA-binding NarL/FixJ family response regulator